MTAQQAVSTQASGRAVAGSSGRMIAGRRDPASAFAPAVNPAPRKRVPYRTGSGRLLPVCLGSAAHGAQRGKQKRRRSLRFWRDEQRAHGRVTGLAGRGAHIGHRSDPARGPSAVTAGAGVDHDARQRLLAHRLRHRQDHSSLLVWLRRPGSDASGDPPFTVDKALQPRRWNSVDVVVSAHASILIAVANVWASRSRWDMAVTGRGHGMANSASSKAIDTSSAGS